MQGQRDLYIRNIFSVVAPYIDTLTTGFSLGISTWWRKKMIEISGIRSGYKVLDLCTGTGELAMLLSKRVGPEGTVTGVDFCREMLDRAEEKKRPDSNITYMLGDAKALVFRDNSFDAVTVSFGMRNIPDTCSALKEARRVLRPGGNFICLELTRPHAGWFMPFYNFYIFNVMPWIANKVIKKDTPYKYLPRSIDAFYTPETFGQVIRECGFSEVTIYPMTMGAATIFMAIKRGQS